MPTSPSTQYSGIRLDPYMDSEDSVQTAVSLVTGTYVAGTVIGEVTATPGTYKAYASGSSDGSQIPKMLLEYGCTVDGSGNITMPGDIPVTRKDVPAYFAGTFRCSDLTGLDANAVTAGGWRLVSGSVSTGILRLG
jgi:hypothetical protein